MACSLGLGSEALASVSKFPARFQSLSFESVAALVRNVHAQDSMIMDNMQARLFPAYDVVFQKDVQEFHPNVLQVSAILVCSKE